jgi:hypothetical protein
MLATDKEKGNVDENCEFEVKGNTLVIRIDLTQEHGPSGSGKTTIVGKGKATLPGGVTCQVNCYKKAPKSK